MLWKTLSLNLYISSVYSTFYPQKYPIDHVSTEVLLNKGSLPFVGSCFSLTYSLEFLKMNLLKWL